jgi:chromosomal replication initiator protein
MISVQEVWKECLYRLRTELKRKYPESEFNTFNTWIQTLQVKLRDKDFFVLAPNNFVVDWLKQHFEHFISDIVKELYPDLDLRLMIIKGSIEDFVDSRSALCQKQRVVEDQVDKRVVKYGSQLNSGFTFNTFVKGKSNEFACAAALKVATGYGSGYNPLLIYGGVGLGKTHLMHAIGNAILEKDRRSNVLYLHSERFVANMIKALQTDTIDEFQRHYRSVDFLLIDDIQFLAGKDRSQEEFFHTFNTLIEEHKQIVLTCDRYPKEIGGLKERLRSRFGWGLMVAIEPPELETRVAILMNKAKYAHIQLPADVAFFIAKRMYSNIRELEGALKRVAASADFMGVPITLGLVKEVLKDLIALQDKLVTIENIQRVVAEYYRIKVSDLLSKRRCRSVTKPRQIAMALAKELTDRSFPEIGDAFGGRDHTTVLYACRKIKGDLQVSSDIQEDYSNLLRVLTA